LIPEAFSDTKIAELQKKLDGLTVQAAQLDVNYGPDNPQTTEVQQQITAVQRQLEATKRSLEDKLKNDFERSVSDEMKFKEKLEIAKNESALENQDTIQYGILKEEVDTAKHVYKNFLEKSNQAGFELAQQQNNIRVVESARVPKISMGPNRKLWILIGMGVGLGLGLGIAILLEFLDHTIKTADDINRKLQLPALAVIPTIGEKPQRTLWSKMKVKQKFLSAALSINGSANGHDHNSAIGPVNDSAKEPTAPISNQNSIILDNRSHAAEAYRLLRTSIIISSENHGIKTILITSAQPGEGKTTTVINTAMSLAQLGKSVLIIDCDLRTPKVHERLGVHQKPGLSTHLSGNAKLNTVIQKLKVPGVSLLSSGAVPENPSELISSYRMKEMLQSVSQRYDHILIDSAPLVSLADTVILSTLVDGIILIVHAGKINRDAVRRARQELSNVGVSVSGVVLNNASGDNFVSYESYSNYQP
jgi:capsular exopolysaccharide synthesis family protein